MVDADNRVAIVAAGGIPAVIAALTHAASADVAEAACNALHQLAVVDGSRVAFAKAVITAMTSNAAFAGVAYAACDTLYSIAIDDDNRVAIAAAGGVQCITAAKAAHPEFGELADVADKALRELA